jgi:hypothetical protein
MNYDIAQQNIAIGDLQQDRYAVTGLLRSVQIKPAPLAGM